MKKVSLAIILGLSLFFSGCPAPFEYWRMQYQVKKGI
jgi:hypothetical protein